MSVTISIFIACRRGTGTPKAHPHKLPIARAECDDCGAGGPPVECRPLPARPGRVDEEASGLARAVSGFTETFEPAKMGRMGRVARTVMRCRACQDKHDAAQAGARGFDA